MSKVESPRRAPTDVELMEYFDGELAEPRLSEVRDFVQRDAAAQAKMTGLDAVSRLVQARAETSSASFGDFDLASSVLARAEREASSDPPPSRSIHSARPRKSVGAPAPAATKPANDNATRIYFLAGLAAVAAVVFLWWGRSAPDQALEATNTAEPAGSTLVEVATTVTAEDRTAPPVVAEADPPDQTGVEVASVDFGRRSGAIFHVPTDVRGATTTVLWLSDE